MAYVRDRADFSIVKTFWNFVYFVTFFFRALLGPFFGNAQSDPDAQSRYRTNLRGGGDGRGGGGGGGGWRPGGGGGGPRRPMGRLNMDGPSSMPSCPMGGCCG
uniref:Selenoprotein K n=1 Tax=Meloidogyne incognita TaxID=6306 RepID=A0A914LYZ7_MELIC